MRLRESVESLWENLAEGWRHLARTAAGALTRFKAGEKTELPAKAEVDDVNWLPSLGWGMLGGDVYEDGKRLVVRLEVPGLEKEDMQVEVVGDALVVSGEKRFQREGSEGRWRVMQCAYGSFRRVVPLPAPVRIEEARATYRNGVLRIELPKITPSVPESTVVRVD